MSQELRNLQQTQKATFEDDTIPLTFGNDTEALKSSKEGVAICDRAHWGLLKLSDEDRLQFLHNQTTNDLKSLKSGQGCNTIFVTSTGRLIDLVNVYVTEDAVFLLVSPHRRQQLLDWMDRYLFPMDRVKIEDLSTSYAVFSLFGAESDSLLSSVGLNEIIGQAENTHKILSLDDTEVRVAVGNGLALPGYTFIVPIDKATQVWSKLTTVGAVPMGNRAWDTLRIQQGRPAADTELTEDYNPLEAGLWKAISFTKGCYIGQETIARLNTYKGVKQRLWGIKLEAPAKPGTVVTLNDEKIGILTSYAETPDSPIGLAYIRTKAGEAGLKVQVGDTEGEVVSVPFLTHNYYTPEK